MLCVSSCTQQILRSSQKLNSHGFHYAEMADSNECIGCRCCADICPDAAIEIEREVSVETDNQSKPSAKSAGKKQK
jgi:2-oxoglutarate ferredoxin oxidoreductase subunit delta